MSETVGEVAGVAAAGLRGGAGGCGAGLPGAVQPRALRCLGRRRRIRLAACFARGLPPGSVRWRASSSSSHSLSFVSDIPAIPLGCLAPFSFRQH